jgi:hypothetical protein
MKALRYRNADKSLARPGRKQATATEDLIFIYPIIIIIGGILVLFIYTTRLASRETSPPSNTIHREVGRAKDLSASLYFETQVAVWQPTRLQIPEDFNLHQHRYENLTPRTTSILLQVTDV